MNCSVTYKLAETCKKMRFSCSSLDILNEEGTTWYGWGCRYGDRMKIEYHNDTGGIGWMDTKR